MVHKLREGESDGYFKGNKNEYNLQGNWSEQLYKGK